MKSTEDNYIETVPIYDNLFKESEIDSQKGKSHFLFKLLKLNIKPIFWTTILLLFQNAPIFVTPIFTAKIINIATDCVASGNITNDTWIQIGIYSLIIAVVLLQNVPATMVRSNIVNKMLRTTSAGIKLALVKKLQSLSITYSKDMESGRIQSKFIQDTGNVYNTFNIIMQTLIPCIVNVIASIIISLLNNGFVSLFFLIVIPINIILTMFLRNKIKAKNNDYRLTSESMNAKITTMLDMYVVTKSHGLEDTEIQSVNNTINKNTVSGISLDHTIAKFGSMIWVVNNLLNAFCVIFCAILALLDKIGVGDIVLYQTLFVSLTGYITTIINLLPAFSLGLESVRSLGEIMNVEDVEVTLGKKEIDDIDGNITFKNVYYCYPKSAPYVVKDFSLDVKKGECIAVVGASGSGKTTIMNMIIGFLTPTKGDIYVDGKSIKDINLSEYRHHISVVPQNSVLFSGSIKENITYGLEKWTEEELNRVIEMANINEFLDDLKDGIDTKIGEHGEKLSGGQKQRITIARALIRNPKILILDEATSALDNISEYNVQKAIEQSIKGRTTFIVAHRLSTIRNADRIVVMDSGKCVEMGTYNELMEKKGKFYELKCLNDLNAKNAEENLS